MSDQRYNEQEIIEYLLGSASETDTERFDGLSVTDRDFAAQLDATENDLVDAYIQGELTGAALERLETHYLASPLRRDKVEFARTFQTFARQQPLQSGGALSSELPTRRGALAEFFFRSGVPHEERSVLPWGLVAAALVLLTFAGWWTVHSRSTRNEVVASFLLAPATRGSDQVPTIAVPSNVTAVRMRLKLESDDYPGYRVALTDAVGGNELWHSITLRPGSEGSGKVLEVLLPADTLKRQTYSLVVSGINADGGVEIISNYSFRSVVN
jgi:hypothetical protein